MTEPLPAPERLRMVRARMAAIAGGAGQYCPLERTREIKRLHAMKGKLERECRPRRVGKPPPHPPTAPA